MEPGPGVGGPGPGVLGPIPVRPGMGYGPAGGVMPGGYPLGMAPDSSQDSSEKTLAADSSVSAGASEEAGKGEVAQVGFEVPVEGTACPPGGACAHGGACPPGAGCGAGGLLGLGGIAGLHALEAGVGNMVTVPPGGGVLGGAGGGGGMIAPGMMPTVQVTFGMPESMQVRYDSSGNGGFDSEPLIVPARQNFPQGGLYRVKITNVRGREGVELYPTIELAHANPRTGAYLAHNSIPIQFTQEDFDQVLSGNFVTKVIYLPDPDYQGPALAGIDTIVSTRLDPGIDPIIEADRRGSILAIIRLGDKDVEMAGCNQTGAAFAGMAANSGAFVGMPIPYAPAMSEGCGPAMGAPGIASCGLPGGSYGPGPGNGNGNPNLPGLPGMVSGVTAPQWGMPISGTPIGLAGPPHIPLGVPAGLRKHVIKNHTPMHIPQPVHDLKMHVRQAPGLSYPNPVSRVYMTEQNVHPGIPHTRPYQDHASQRVY